MPNDSVKSTNAHPSPTSIETTALRLFESGQTERAFGTIERYLEDHAGNLEPETRSELAHLQFEIAQALTDSTPKRRSAMNWLEAMADAGDAAWLPLREPATRSALEDAFVEPTERLELLEQLSFAPASTGLAQEAVSLIEDFGHVHAGDPNLAREAERLLHALGERDAAYRVEQSRRTASGRQEKPPRKGVEKAEVRLTGLTVAIAGGHPALRRAIHNDLIRAGAKEIREIPPRWEGSRQGREVVGLLAGSDVAVLIGRHISHSTVDQVKRGAALAGIPVLASFTASASGVRKALEQHIEMHRLDKLSRPT